MRQALVLQMLFVQTPGAVQGVSICHSAYVTAHITSSMYMILPLLCLLADLLPFSVQQAVVRHDDSHEGAPCWQNRQRQQQRLHAEEAVQDV